MAVLLRCKIAKSSNRIRSIENYLSTTPHNTGVLSNSSLGTIVAGQSIGVAAFCQAGHQLYKELEKDLLQWNAFLENLGPAKRGRNVYSGASPNEPD